MTWNNLVVVITIMYFKNYILEVVFLKFSTQIREVIWNKGKLMNKILKHICLYVINIESRFTDLLSIMLSPTNRQIIREKRKINNFS